MDLPLGWHTDVAVRRLAGSLVTELDDHLVVRTPANPTFCWGNFVLVTDPTVADDPDRWLTVFARHFPGSAHRAIGLSAAPRDPAAWAQAGLELETADVLVSDGPVAGTAAPAGYLIRALDGPEDWRRSTRLRCGENPGGEEFEARTTEERVATRDVLTWFGAFAGDELAAELGILDCGDGIARYQSVLTDRGHRRRGLARHLLAVAGRHAAGRGATTQVILADTGSAASRLYRDAGFRHQGTAYQVYRAPA